MKFTKQECPKKSGYLRFIDALKQHRYKDATAMFAPAQTQDGAAIEYNLKRIDASLGGFATIHPVAALPNGKSIKLEFSAQKSAPPNPQAFTQIRYVFIASDGQPVFFELNVGTNGLPLHLLSLGLHFPATDTQSSTRANQLINHINRIEKIL